MTSNQIAYHNAQETKRHNIATEQETNRHQVMQEALTRWANAIQSWQVAVNDAHYARMDAETGRANRAREQQNAASLRETYRSNVSNEDIKRASNRLEAAQIAETSRHQRTMESIQDRLNRSTIKLNEAKSVESGATTGYTAARTQTERRMPNKIINEIDMINSQANLNRANTGYTRFKEVESAANSVTNVIGVIGKVLGSFR